VQKQGEEFANHNTKDSNWESLVQRTTRARSCALIKAYCGERAWKAISYNMLKSYCLSRVDHVRKIGDGKQRTYVGKYSFVNRAL
jgi:hypothetical protein